MSRVHLAFVSDLDWVSFLSVLSSRACVGFNAKSRVMGVAARQQAMMNLKNSVMDFKHLIGRRFSDPIAQDQQKWLPCEMVQLPDDNIGLKASFFGSE